MMEEDILAVKLFMDSQLPLLWVLVLAVLMQHVTTPHVHLLYLITPTSLLSLSVKFLH